jgi:hypothetical protein
MDDAPLDEYTLDFLDEVHPDAKPLVKRMLAAVADYPNVHHNGFSVSRTQDGYDYFVAMGGTGGGTSPFRQHQVHPFDVVDLLIHHRIAQAKINPQWPNDFRSFTDRAIEWHHTYGGPDDDEVNKRIGRILYQYVGAVPPSYRIEEVAQKIGVPPERVNRQIRILKAAGFAHSVLAGDVDDGHLALTEPVGVRWAAAGFPPIGTFNSLALDVSVNLRLDFNAVLRDVRAADVDQALKDQLEIRLRRLEEELEKPEGEGSFDTVKDVVETANNSRQLLESVIPLLVRHWDKVQALSDAAGNILPG